MDEWLAEGDYMNSILYRMCSDQPLHANTAAVRGKVLLIGRAYSVAPSRGVTIYQFYDRLAQKIVCHGPGLDEKIEAARKCGRVSANSMGAVIAAHKLLNDLVIDFIKDNLDPQKKTNSLGHRNSFCSKYLHFHAPLAFPILDSVAEKALNERKNEGRYENVYSGLGGTGGYALFCQKFLSYAEVAHDPDNWTPRTVDGELYPYDVINTLKSKLTS